MPEIYVGSCLMLATTSALRATGFGYSRFLRDGGTAAIGAPCCAPVSAACVEICRHEKVISGAKETISEWHGCGLPRAQYRAASMSVELVNRVP
jgi:hypothetical protein